MGLISHTVACPLHVGSTIPENEGTLQPLIGLFPLHPGKRDVRMLEIYAC